MANFYGATGLIGGSTGDLDNIAGTSLSDGDGAMVITSTAAYIYYLNATSGAAESSPDVISPDVDASNKRWILVNMSRITADEAFTVGDPTSHEANISAASNTDVDTGTETIDSFADTIADSAVWFCCVKNGANVRCSTVMAAWDVTGDTVQYTETATLDVGDTSDLTLSVDIDSNTVRLRATAASDNWTVRCQRMAL